ncbi:MAG: HAD-IA family hydrolase [Acidimicrobiales bacterium]
MGSRLEAVVFDVDGTLVDSERHGHRVAFNDAFAAAGLPYSWDEEAYGHWLSVHGGVRRIDAFLEEAGLSEEERQELAPRLHKHKTRLLREMIDAGRIPPRPGMADLLDDLAGSGVRLGLATVGSSGWVTHLLERLFPDVGFEVVITGADVEEKKPHPGCYLQALEGLGVAPEAAVAVEDSATGLAAARAAKLACVVVRNDYTAREDMTGAGLVLDGVDAEAHVLDDPHGLQPSLPLERETFERLLAKT